MGKSGQLFVVINPLFVKIKLLGQQDGNLAAYLKSLNSDR